MLLSSLVSLPAFAAMQAKPVEWKLGKQTFSGVLVYDDASTAKRPGLVMVPDWKGVTRRRRSPRPRHIAGDDYVVLVADMYGKGVRPKDDDEAMAQVKQLYADRSVLRARVNKALEVLKAQAGNAPLDPRKHRRDRVTASVARPCWNWRAAAPTSPASSSFHGGLATSMPAKPGAVKASLLVLNGADDTGTTPRTSPAFEKEMDAAGADWQFVNFSGAVHCFALPEARQRRRAASTTRARGEACAFAMMRRLLRRARLPRHGEPAGTASRGVSGRG